MDSLDLSCEARSAKQDGGEDGIRTHEKLLTSTPLAGERLRPLGHLSVAPVDKEKRRHNQQACTIIIEKTGFRRSAAFAMRRFCGNPLAADSAHGRNSGGQLPESAGMQGLAQGFPTGRWLTGAF
jgi:hypothetical protein